MIPSNRFDPASAQVMQRYYPEPNTAGSISATGQQINNYLINPELTRNDDQFDVKVDHVLTQTNRFFGRYSYQKTLRDLPATLPLVGDAGATFGAGKGDIKAQSFAFNDTHTFGTQVAERGALRLELDQVLHDADRLRTNPAAAVGIPGINLNDATSAMTQLGFQTIRNIGANGNQPLITNQNDFQFFDNVTWLKGKHTDQDGRQPDPPLARDPQRRHHRR